MTTETSSLDAIISEGEFLTRLEGAAQGLLCLGFELVGADTPPPKKALFRVTDESNALESFLDDYGARYNKTYSHFTELVACLRGFSLSSYSLTHLLGRIAGYRLADELELLSPGFRGELQRRVGQLWEFMKVLFLALDAEGRNLGILRLADPLVNRGLTQEIHVRQTLPHNVDEVDISGEEAKIAEVVSRYLKAVELLAALGIDEGSWMKDLSLFRDHRASEALCREYETAIHNIQSKYDTYIKNTGIERQNIELPILRGHVSLVLHLLECATFLSHFYERHENDIRYEVTKQRIAELIDKRSVVEFIVEFCLVNSWKVLKRGKGVAETLLSTFTDQRSVRLAIPAGIHLHARPASMIVSVVNHHGTPCFMELNGQRCDATSIMQVMILAGSNSEAREVVFYGDRGTLADLASLFEYSLGEDSGRTPPAQLGYLF